MEKINTGDDVALPVLPAESLLVSIRNPGEFLLSLLFLLLLFLGERPLKVLDHSIFLLLWSVTLTLLLAGEESRTMKEFISFERAKIRLFTTSMVQLKKVVDWTDTRCGELIWPI